MGTRRGQLVLGACALLGLFVFMRGESGTHCGPPCCCLPSSARCVWSSTPPFTIPTCEQDNLVAILRWLQGTANIPFHLTFGTLLGAMREGGHIQTDTDIDIAIDRAVWQAAMHNITQAISADASNHFVFQSKLQPAKLFFSRFNQIHVDMWVYDHGSTHVSGGTYPWRTLIVPNEIIFPLRTCDYNGHAYQCPAKSEEWLDQAYPGWRTPLSRRDGFAGSVDIKPSSANSIAIPLNFLIIRFFLYIEWI